MALSHGAGAMCSQFEEIVDAFIELRCLDPIQRAL